MTGTPRIYLVDDDASILRALTRLLSAEGHRVESFDRAEAFLTGHDPDAPGCAILDLHLPGMGGLSIQSRLQEAAAPDGPVRPVIFLTGQGSVPDSVRAMKAGAVDFLEKPVDASLLLSAVDAALARDGAQRVRADLRHDLHERLSTLSPREREVMDLVIAGLLNKQIAAELGIAERTTKVHRGRVMKKMGARTVADLVRLVTRDHA